MLTDQGNVVNSELTVLKTSQIIVRSEEKYGAETLLDLLPSHNLLLLDTALCSDREMKRQ